MWLCEQCGQQHDTTACPEFQLRTPPPPPDTENHKPNVLYVRQEQGDKMASNEDLENIYTYHAPKGDQQRRYETLRHTGKVLAKCILDLTPVSREQSLALTKLEEAIMWANASIARNE